MSSQNEEQTNIEQNNMDQPKITQTEKSFPPNDVFLLFLFVSQMKRASLKRYYCNYVRFFHKYYPEYKFYRYEFLYRYLQALFCKKCCVNFYQNSNPILVVKDDLFTYITLALFDDEEHANKTLKKYKKEFHILTEKEVQYIKITNDIQDLLNYYSLSSCDESDEREFNELAGLDQYDKTISNKHTSNKVKPTSNKQLSKKYSSKRNTFLHNQPKRSSSTLTDQDLDIQKPTEEIIEFSNGEFLSDEIST